MGYDHENRTVGEKLGRMADAPALSVRNRGRAGLRILGIQQHSEFIYFRF